MNKHHPSHCQQSSLHSTVTKNIDFRHCLITCHPKINHFIRNILNVLSPRLGYWIIFYSQHSFLYWQLLQKTKGNNCSEIFPLLLNICLYNFKFLYKNSFKYKFSIHKKYIRSDFFIYCQR